MVIIPGRCGPQPIHTMSRPSLLPHAIWGIIAAGAFAGGLFTGNRNTTGNQENTGGNSKASTAQATATPWRSGSASKPGNVQTDGQPSATVLGSVNGVMNAADMKTTLDSILKETDPIKRNRLFAELLDHLTPENVQVALDTLRDGGMEPGNFRDMALLTYAWGKMDPEKALAYAAEVGGRGQAFMTSSVLSGWASANPQAAMDWLHNQKSEGFEKNIMARGLIEGLMQNDPEAATRLAVAETDAELQGQFFDSIARQQIKTQGAEATRAWLDKMLASGTVNAASLGSAVREVADQLADKDPKATAQWAMTLPAGDAQEGAIRESVRAWARTDPTATSQFLTGMAASPAKDRAVENFARTVAREDPQAAATWAATITDQELRDRTMLRTAQEWYQKDAQAATTWAQSSGLSADAQQKIQNPPEEGRGGGGPPGMRGGGFGRGR